MSQANIIIEPDWGMDFGKSPQLEIRFLEVRDDLLYVFGVVHSAIKIGDRFRKISQFNPTENTQDRLGDDVALIDLRVESITAYHTRLNRVNADMNAAFELSGDWNELFVLLDDNGWSTEDENSHQWRDNVLDSEKLVLTK